MIDIKRNWSAFDGNMKRGFLIANGMILVVILSYFFGDLREHWTWTSSFLTGIFIWAFVEGWRQLLFKSSWETVYQTDKWAYQVHRRTGARRAIERFTGGHQPRHQDWLDGKTDTFGSGCKTPPIGGSAS